MFSIHTEPAVQRLSVTFQLSITRSAISGRAPPGRLGLCFKPFRRRWWICTALENLTLLRTREPLAQLPHIRTSDGRASGELDEPTRSVVSQAAFELKSNALTYSTGREKQVILLGCWYARLDLSIVGFRSRSVSPDYILFHVIITPLIADSLCMVCHHRVL